METWSKECGGLLDCASIDLSSPFERLRRNRIYGFDKRLQTLRSGNIGTRP
jgi:hypothetical protein